MSPLDIDLDFEAFLMEQTAGYDFDAEYDAWSDALNQAWLDSLPTQAEIEEAARLKGQTLPF
jgi:hypothetical protein